MDLLKRPMIRKWSVMVILAKLDMRLFKDLRWIKNLDVNPPRPIYCMEKVKDLCNSRYMFSLDEISIIPPGPASGFVMLLDS
jgi:hypothetical protein